MEDYLRYYEELIEEALESDILCNDRYCPYHIRHMNSPFNPNCEGAYCEEAFSKFLKENKY